MATPPNQYFPSFPSLDPKSRRDMQNVWDRLNFLVGRVGEIESQAQGPTKETLGLRGEISELRVALQTVNDALTQGGTFVNMPGGSQVVSPVMQVSTAPRLLGRFGPGGGPTQEIQVGTGLVLSGAGVLSSSGGGGNDLTAPPTASSWTFVNQGGATKDDSSNIFVGAKKVTGVHIVAPAVSGPNLRILKIAAPSTPYTITAGFTPFTFSDNTYSFGAVWRQSSDGKLIEVGNNVSGNFGAGQWRVSKFDSPTSFNSHYKTANASFATGPVVWIRIADDGTNRISSYSADGDSFFQFHSVGRTDFLTADEVGWELNVENTTNGSILGLVHWVVT